jgi:non-heme chloroperoxidase
VEITGDSWGDAGGPLVVLLHGGGQTRHAWKGTGAQLGASGYHAVALDARGHGDSGWALDGDYGRPAMIDDLVAVLAALGAGRPALVGASMGGDTALLALGEGRIQAAALVLVDVAPRLAPDAVGIIRGFMDERPEGFASLEEVAGAIQSYQPHRPRPERLDGLAKNVRMGDDGRYHWHWDPGFHSTSVDLDERRRHLEACVRRLAVPTLLVRGGLSDVLTEDAASEFLELCPHAEYVDVADAAHMVVGDRNDVFSTAVSDFLTRVQPVR